MNDNELHIDRTCHVLYSNRAKRNSKRESAALSRRKTEKVEQVQRK